MEFQKSDIDLLWLLFCTSLVFIMQAGFLCLEAGLTRSKNSINVAIKNLATFGIVTLIFAMWGFGLNYGTSFQGWLGLSHYASDFLNFHPFESVFFYVSAHVLCDIGCYYFRRCS